jgi:hypothetical protein
MGHGFWPAIHLAGEVIGGPELVFGLTGARRYPAPS